jgi:hypothetical protein
VEGHEERGLAPTGRGLLGWRGSARGRRTCPHSGGWRRVTDERGLASSGRVRGREARGAHGSAGEGNGVDRARMNNDDF